MARGKSRTRKTRNADKPRRMTAAAQRRGTHVIDVPIDTSSLPSYKQRPVKKPNFGGGVPGTGKAAASRSRHGK